VPPLNLVGDYGGGALYLAFGCWPRCSSASARAAARWSTRRWSTAPPRCRSSTACTPPASGTRARGSNLLDGGAPFYDTYETADGRHIALAALEPKFFAELALAARAGPRFVARQYDRRLWPEMREAIATAIVRRSTRDEWCSLLEGSDACFAPVLSLAEAPLHPMPQARGAFVTSTAWCSRRRRRASTARRGAAGPAPATRGSTPPRCWPRPASARPRSPRCARREPADELQRTRARAQATGSAPRPTPARRVRCCCCATARRPRGADAAPRRARRRHAQRRRVFPGGVLDARPRRPPPAASAPTTPALSARLGLAEGGLDYAVAAVRETFEEVGLLLACALTARVDTVLATPPPAPWRDRLQPARPRWPSSARHRPVLDLRGSPTTATGSRRRACPSASTRASSSRRGAGRPGGAGRLGEAVELMWLTPQEALSPSAA
jgi:8-oxo-dGTP pyrophosphatase MutT (NUDIX family)